MYEAAASCKDITRIPVTNWEPQCVTLAGYCYAVRRGMKVQLVTPYRVSHLQRYGVMIRGNVTSVYPPIRSSWPQNILASLPYQSIQLAGVTNLFLTTLIHVTFQLIHDTSRQRHWCILPDALNTVKCTRWWAKTSPEIQGDSKRWTQFRKSIFPELYMVCEWST